MLESLKTEVMNAAKRAQRDGLCKHKSGNFSMRDKNTGLIVITPTGVDREKLQPEDMVVMDMDANVIEHETGLKPTSEALMHLMIYKTRPDVHAIAHTHCLYATIFAIMNKEIPAISYEMIFFNTKNQRVPVAPYGRPGTADLAESVVDACQESDAFLLKGHGAVTVDADDIEGAYLKMAYLDEVAEIYHHILAVTGGSDPDHFPQEEFQKWAYPAEISFPKIEKDDE